MFNEGGITVPKPFQTSVEGDTALFIFIVIMDFYYHRGGKLSESFLCVYALKASLLRINTCVCGKVYIKSIIFSYLSLCYKCAISGFDCKLSLF